MNHVMADIKWYYNSSGRDERGKKQTCTHIEIDAFLLRSSLCCKDFYYCYIVLKASSRARSTHSYSISQLSWSPGSFCGSEALLTLIIGDRVCFYSSNLKLWRAAVFRNYFVKEEVAQKHKRSHYLLPHCNRRCYLARPAFQLAIPIARLFSLKTQVAAVCGMTC